MSYLQLFGNELMGQNLIQMAFDPNPPKIELPDYYHRSLSHKADPQVLNGKNLKLRAKRDKKTGECKIYKETQWQHFIRIGNLLNPRKNKKLKFKASDFDINEVTKLIGYAQQGRFGNNKTPKPSILEPFKLLAWNAWTSNKGMSVKLAREKYIRMCEKIAKRLKQDTTNPKLPGPDYYEGCGFSKRAQKKKLAALEKEDEAIVVESQEAMMVDNGPPIGSIIFLIVFYMCCFCCIGCCVWMCKRRKKNAEKVDEIDIEVANIEEYEDNKKTVVMATPKDADDQVEKLEDI